MQCPFIDITHSDDGVAQLTLNRPDKRNALNLEMILFFQSMLNKWSTDNQIRLLVIDAKGPCFCSGIDLEWMKNSIHLNYEENLQDVRVFADLLETIYYFPKPVICLVQGEAYGGAIGMIAASDIAISQCDAQFCLSEVKMGLIPSIISPYLANAIGIRQTQRYALSAETFSADTAKNMGLIHEITEQETLQPCLQDIIKAVRLGCSEAQTTTKSLFHHLQKNPGITTQTIEYTTEIIAKVRTNPTAQEGSLAFLENRDPSWVK